MLCTLKARTCNVYVNEIYAAHIIKEKKDDYLQGDRNHLPISQVQPWEVLKFDPYLVISCNLVLLTAPLKKFDCYYAHRSPLAP